MPDNAVFYSWQSDLPNATNRTFIENALEKATKAIRNDATIQAAPRVDRDTAGVPGARSISDTIFQKIEQADVFVADVTIINPTGEGRMTPNPNVLIELGYALRALGDGRVVMVMNTAYGAIEQLPFDLRGRKTIPYELADAQADRTAARTYLEKRLGEEIRHILTDLGSRQEATTLPPAEAVVAAVENRQPNDGTLAKKYMAWLDGELAALQPDIGQGDDHEALIAALDKAVPVVQEFGRVAEAISAVDAPGAARAIYKGFGHILSRYHLPKNHPGGQYLTYQFDFFKFLGHELLATLVGALINEDRWDTIAAILDEDLLIEDSRGLRAHSFDYACQHVGLIDIRNQALKCNRSCLHADILKQRHTDTVLKETMPWDLFLDADLFLFLRSVVPFQEPDPRRRWVPWSAPYAQWRTPRYLLEASRQPVATRLARSFGIDDVETLRDRLAAARTVTKEMFGRNAYYQGAFADFDLASLGSRP